MSVTKDGIIDPEFHCVTGVNHSTKTNINNHFFNVIYNLINKNIGKNKRHPNNVNHTSYTITFKSSYSLRKVDIVDIDIRIVDRYTEKHAQVFFSTSTKNPIERMNETTSEEFLMVIDYYNNNDIKHQIAVYKDLGLFNDILEDVYGLSNTVSFLQKSEKLRHKNLVII